jgi:hypothetical protein
MVDSPSQSLRGASLDLQSGKILTHDGIVVIIRAVLMRESEDEGVGFFVHG